MWVVPYLFILWMCGPCRGENTSSCLTIPGYQPLIYASPGDIKIGLITFGRDYSSETGCAPTVSSVSLMQGSTAVAYAVKSINEDTSILPNLTVGFVMTDSCRMPQMALASAMNFVPPGICNVKSSIPLYDVVGIVSVTTSSSAVNYGNYLNLFRVPMVGSVSTAESLSEKKAFKYFVRVVPSDYYQAKAMVAILQHFNWSYISTVHSEGDYGSNGVRAIQKLVQDREICIAYSAEIELGADEARFDYIVRGLMRHRNARVVILFTQTVDGVALLNALIRNKATNHFIIIGSDAMALGFSTEDIKDVITSGLTIALSSTKVLEYEKFYSQMTVGNNPDPWLMKAMSHVLGCSWEEGDMNECDPDLQMGNSALFQDSFVISLTVDAVYALAHATHEYITNKCPEAFRDRSKLKSCIKREEILPYLYDANFIGSSGEILRFDKNGDAQGKYDVLQQKPQKDGAVTNVVIGKWDKYTSKLNLFEHLYWTPGHLTGGSVPESICSHPCESGQFLVQLEQICCWECRKCRNNEIVVRNGSACKECKLLTWPNQKHFLSCDQIEPSFLQWTEPQALACLILAGLGLVFSVLMVILFTKYREQRLIKATSRELSMLTLSGVILSYVAAFVLLSKPITVSCYTGRICFNLSFAIAYAPLVAKVTRIHRIFAAAKHGTKPPSFISTRSQVVLSMLLISIQAVLSAVSVVLYPPDVTLTMPLTTEAFVEMLCSLPVTAVLYSLTYNLLLMLACSIFAFKARRLPDNFNESKFIFVCVCTTLFLWLAFIPSYFSAFYASQKIVLLVSVLLFNSAVMLLCLYMPRIYAVMYLDETKQGVSATGEQVASTKNSTVSN